MTPILFVAGITTAISVQQATTAWRCHADGSIECRRRSLFGAVLGAALTAFLIGMAVR